MTERQRAIVVGGAGGIGGAICRRLASKGCRVVVADRNVLAAAEVLRALDGDGHDTAQFDITDEAAVAAAFDAIEAGGPASILVVASARTFKQE